ncbi:MAG: polysaccharide biosynthesis/export family protein [Candidatus Ratteibacteria bacterium]|nr:polysaccharide biosynthesis/export family protein [Candidatus Ratteibacteria bacterium]
MKLKSVLRIAVLCFVSLSIIMPVRAQEPDYRLQPEDVLDIAVYEQPDLDTTVRISSTGEIAFPLLGKIEAAGFTVSELKEKIEKLLAKDYLVEPQVQVFIGRYHVKQVSVLGAVKQPGKYDMYTEKETTVLEAIAMAGGFSDIASVNGTRIIRKEDGEERIIPVKITDITKKGMKEKDVSLQAADIIFVPESFF